MTRREVRDFIRDGVDLMNPPVEHNEGVVSDFAAQRSNQYPATLLVLETVDSEESLSAPLDSWAIRLIVFKIDKMDSTPEIYEDMVDECDDIARKLIYQYRNIVEGYKLITISGLSRKKFVKSPEFGPDCLTGIEINFNLNAPDQGNVC